MNRIKNEQLHKSRQLRNKNKKDYIDNKPINNINNIKENNIDPIKTLLITPKMKNPDIDFHYPENPLVENGILPKPPCTVMVIGGTGSGKSTMIIYLLKKHYLDTKIFNRKHVFLLSPTGKIDPLFKYLKLKNPNIITEDILTNIVKLVKKQTEEVKGKGIKKSPKMLLIIEDASDNAEMLNDSELKKLFTRNRHINCSVFIVAHKYRALNRMARLNANHIMMFPINNSETDQLIEDYAPRIRGLTKREAVKKMNDVIDYAFEPTEEDVRPFLYLNNKKPFNRFHKGFYEQLNISTE